MQSNQLTNTDLSAANLHNHSTNENISFLNAAEGDWTKLQTQNLFKQTENSSDFGKKKNKSCCSNIWGQWKTLFLIVDNPANNIEQYFKTVCSYRTILHKN